MIHLEVCPLCSGKSVPRYTSTDYFLSGERFIISECKECSFVFTSDQPSEDEAGKYYESGEYISHSNTSQGFTNKAYLVARSLMLKSKKALIKKVSGISQGALLDIGCGTGFFANEMKKSGWNVKGIEINEKARAYATEHFGLEVLDPSKINTLEKKQFDCITLWHVLEHFSNPFDYMKKISELLKPEGTCIVALPNCSSFDAGHYKEFWAAWDVPRHLWHFTPRSFSLFCEKTGFEIKEIRKLPLDVFYISILSEKYRKSDLAFLKGSFRGGIFWFLSLFNKKRSSSLIYILKKS